MFSILLFVLLYYSFIFNYKFALVKQLQLKVTYLNRFLMLKSPMIIFNWRKNFPIWINVFLPNLLSYFFNRLNWKRISIWKCSDQEGYWNWVHFDLFSSLLVFCQKNRRVPQVHFVKFYKKKWKFYFSNTNVATPSLKLMILYHTQTVSSLVKSQW